MNRPAMKKECLQKGRILSNVALPSGGGPMPNGLNLSRRDTSRGQRCRATSTQGVTRKGRGRKGEPKTPQKPCTRRNRTICADPKKGMQRKSRITTTKILEEKAMGVWREGAAVMQMREPSKRSSDLRRGTVKEKEVASERTDEREVS